MLYAFPYYPDLRTRGENDGVGCLYEEMAAKGNWSLFLDGLSRLASSCMAHYQTLAALLRSSETSGYSMS